MKMSSGKRIRITFGGSARGDTSSIGPADTASTAPGGASGSVQFASPSTDIPHQQCRARGRLVTASARRKQMHDVDASRHLLDEEMGADSGR